jgi:alpha-2-macroglobulin
MNTRFTFRWSYLLLFFICVALLFGNCKRKTTNVVSADPKFRELISAYTSGIISSQSTIRIRLANDYSDKIVPNSPIDKNLFEFTPSIKGTSYWIDNRTIEFRPGEKLKSASFYNCKFHLSELFDLKPEFKIFEFGFQTIMQSFSVRIQGFKPYESTNLAWNKITGSIITSDVIEIEEIRKVLSAFQGTLACKINMTSDQDRKVFNFSVDSIQRTDKEGIVTVNWDGKVILLAEKGSEKIVIPSLSDFKLMQTQVSQEPEQFIKLVFSDPLMKNQNLDGLIRLENGTSLTYAINENELRVYPIVRQMGTAKLIIEEGIKNIMGFRFKENQSINLVFESLKPALRLIGKGVILPNSQGLLFPFEAVNLHAVEIKIIRIFENNVAQFFQVNRLDQENELKRVGRLILKKEIPLNSSSALDYGAWNTFFLDLGQLIKQEPGAIYRVEISFNKKNSIYHCAGKSTSDNTEEMEVSHDDDFEQEISYWDSYENYYEYDEGEYYNYNENLNYSKRDDPCENEYYGKKTFCCTECLCI